MLTTKQTNSVQKHLQSVFESSVRAELKYILEEDIISGLPDDAWIDDFLVSIQVTVLDASSVS